VRAGLRTVRRRLAERAQGKFRSVVADDPAVAAKALPYAGGASTFTILAPPGRSDGDGPRNRPVPPVDRWDLPDETDPRVYLDSGEETAQLLTARLRAHGVELAPNPTVLDFGCGYGRLVRWLGPWAALGEVWGADVDGERIEWARRCLGPPFQFVTITSAAHLPFEDDTFDLVVGHSVLPHIADGADAWMLELRRVTRPGGHVYLTVYDDHTATRIREGAGSPDLAAPLAEAEALAGRLGDGVDVIALNRRVGGAQVFRSTAWIERVWGAWFDIVAIEPDAFHLQTGVLLRKRVRR